MKFALIGLGFLVAGCAAPPRQQAMNYSSPVLCYGVYAGNTVQQDASRHELARRGFSCTESDREMGRQEWAALQARRQQEADQSLAAGIYLLNAGRAPPPPTPSPTLTCRTVPLGSGVSQTICN